MRKIFLACPSYSGKLKPATQMAIQCFTMEASALGWELEQFHWQNDSLIVHARNAIVGKFLETDCTDLFFVDDDVAVGPGVFTRLMMNPNDFVGAVYRMKKDEETYAVLHMQSDPMPDENGMLEVGGIPFGMVRLRRSVLEKMVDAVKDDWFWAASVPNLKCWMLFNTSVENHIFYGEDILFCRKWRDLGGSIWVDADIPIQHISATDKVYPGNYGLYLRKQKQPVELKAVA